MRKSRIIDCCRGKQKTTNGYIWKYSTIEKHNLPNIKIKSSSIRLNNLWKKITYKEKEYYVSKTGDIANISGLILKKQIKNGYLFINSRRTHRIIAIAYLDNPNNLPVVNHKDGNKLNNNVENLEWCTQKDNMIHFNKNNLIKKDNRQKKFTNMIIKII